MQPLISALPSREELAQLINYAEIGFMSAFLKKLDEIIHSGASTEAFSVRYAAMHRNVNLKKSYIT